MGHVQELFVCLPEGTPHISSGKINESIDPADSAECQRLYCNYDYPGITIQKAIENGPL